MQTLNVGLLRQGHPPFGENKSNNEPNIDKPHRQLQMQSQSRIDLQSTRATA